MSTLNKLGKSITVCFETTNQRTEHKSTQEEEATTSSFS